MKAKSNGNQAVSISRKFARSNAIRTCRILFCCCLAAISAAASAQSNQVIQIKGRALAGAVKNGLIWAYPVNQSGKLAQPGSKPLSKPVRSDNHGRYNFSVPIPEHIQALLIEVTADHDTSMRCDVIDGCGKDLAGQAIKFGQWFPLRKDFQMQALVPVPIPVENTQRAVSVDITPLTHIATLYTRSMAGGATRQNIQAALRDTALAFDMKANSLRQQTADITLLDQDLSFDENAIKQAILSAAFISIARNERSQSISDVLHEYSVELVRDHAISTARYKTLMFEASDLASDLAMATLNRVTSNSYGVSYSDIFTTIGIDTLKRFRSAREQILGTPVALTQKTAIKATPPPTRKPKSFNIRILRQPASLIISQGVNATMEVRAVSNGPLQYQWFRNSIPLAGETRSRIRIVQSRPEDVGVYHVQIASGASRLNSAPVTVSVDAIQAPIMIIQQPESKQVPAGSQVRISIKASGGGAIQYQWRKDGHPILGANKDSLSVAQASQADSGQYSVLVFNGDEAVTSKVASLTVTPRDQHSHRLTQR